MKTIVALMTLMLLVWSIPAVAQTQDHPLGVGVMLGEPTGFTGKYWNSSRSAVDVGAAWSLVDNGEAQIHADYLRHDYGLFHEVEGGAMSLYYGIGGRVLFRDAGDDHVGVRVPLGLSYQFSPQRRFEAFFELAPVVDVVPRTDGDLTGGIGLRYGL